MERVTGTTFYALVHREHFQEYRQRIELDKGAAALPRVSTHEAGARCSIAEPLRYSFESEADG